MPIQKIKHHYGTPAQAQFQKSDTNFTQAQQTQQFWRTLICITLGNFILRFSALSRGGHKMFTNGVGLAHPFCNISKNKGAFFASAAANRAYPPSFCGIFSS